MINSIKHRIASDSILSRFCLASLIWMTVGIGQAWGKKTQGTITIVSGKGSVTITAYYKPNSWTTNTNSGSISTKNENEASNIGKEYTHNYNRGSTEDGWVIFSASAGTGYTFAGWFESSACTGTPATGDYTVDENDCGKAWNNLHPDVTKTLYTKFTPNDYTIVYNGNGSTHGSTASTAAKYDANVTFQTNGFYKAKYVVTYDINGGTCGTAVDTAYYPFEGWARTADGEVVYTDEQTTTEAPNLATSGNGYLYAKWGSGTTSVTLPIPTAVPVYEGEGEYSFAGWYLSTDEATKTVVGVGGATYTPTGNVTLKAKWTLEQEPNFRGEEEGTSFTLNVGDTFDFTFTNTSTDYPSSSSSANFYYVITNTENPSGSRAGSAKPDSVISISGNTITALNNGEATIKFYQKEDAVKNIKKDSSDLFTFSVDRNARTFTWSLPATSYYNDTVAHVFRSSQTDSAVVVSTSDAAIATIVDSALVTYNKEGTATITMTQPENYYWARKSESRTVTPTDRPNAIPLPTLSTWTEDIKNVYIIACVDDDNSVWLDATDHGGVKCLDICYGTKKVSNKYMILAFTGMPDSLYFQFKVKDNKTSSWYIMEGATSSTITHEVWTSTSKSTSWSETQKVKLSPTTRYLKFGHNGDSDAWFKDLVITKKKDFSADVTSFDFATNLRDSDVASKSFKFKHANAGYTVKAALTDSTHYQVSLNNSSFSGSVIIPNTGGNRIDSSIVYVKYIPRLAGEVEETHNAKVVIGDALGDTVRVNLTGKTQPKLSTRLVYIGAESYNANAENIAATTLFEVRDVNNALVASPTITLSSNATSVINTANSNTEITFVSGGSATITASYGGDETTYAAASNLGQLITVNKVDDQITWNGLENDTLHVWMDDSIPYTIASAKTSAAKPITFTSSDASIFKVVEGATIDTMTTLKIDTIELTATTTADGVYNSVSSTKIVVVDPCIHRIVWADDFSGLHPEEDGTIDYTSSDPMSAYAIDSTGARTGVSISYRVSDASIAEVLGDNRLHVKKVGTAKVYATTASDDKYAVATDSLIIRVLTWGDNTAKIEQDEFEGNRDWSGPHADFSISGEGSGTTTFGGDGRKLTLTGGNTYTVAWTLPDKGYSINVKKIHCKFGNAGVSGYDVFLNNNNRGSVGGWSKNDNIYLDNLSLGDDDVITIRATRDANIYWIEMTYTITPNVAPTPTSGVSEVRVTLDPLNPVTLDLSDLFSIADAPDDFEYVCDLAVADAHAHIIGAGTQFWADSAGDYTIKGQVAVAEDHLPSAWSSTYKTIRVTRVPNKVYMGGSDSYSETMLMRSTLEGVALTADNTDYVGSPITCVQIGGVDTISYDPSTQVITSYKILGTGLWRVSQEQSNKYEAAVDTFRVEITNSTYEFTGEVDGEWGKDGNWGEGGKPTILDNVIVSGDLTIAGDVEVYSLNVASDASITITSAGGLTVGAGGIGGAGKNSITLQAGDGTGGTTKGKTGYLRVSPEWDGEMPSATVEMYSIAFANNESQVATWQYVGIPVTGTFKGWDLCEYGDQFIWGWNETNGEWFDAFEEVIQPFQGYSFTQNKESAGDKFTFTGTLQAPNSTADSISLSYSNVAHANRGYHVLANSFAAPIDISRFDVADFKNMAATIYLFNTGSYSASYTIVNAEDAAEATAGQYISIPIATANEIRTREATFPVIIPAMQGFCVQATAAGAKLNLDYNKLIWNANYGLHPNQPMRVKADDNNAQEETTSGTTGFLKVTLSDGESADNLYILSSKDAGYTKKYTNGYDAPKMMSDEKSLPNIFAEEDGYQLAIDATSDLLGTSIGVRRGKASNYTMYFTHVTTEQDLLLLDVEENEVTLIEEGASYEFAINAEQGTVISGRFLIIEAQNGGNQGIATGTEETTVEHTMQKFIYNGRLYILKDGVLYDARGMMIKR